MGRQSGLEKKVGAGLAARGWNLALAESCTGGLVGYRLTSVPGSSRWFRGGVTAYEDGVKKRLLGVLPATLARYGAVSTETATEMARGARRSLGAKVGLSVTGVAGPEGGTAEKPVGLVYAAVSAGRRKACVEGRFGGGRERVRRQASEMALKLLLSFLEDYE